MDYALENIRNIMIAGHSGDGKTSLTEALLFLTKSSDRLGSIADGNTVSDFDPEEIRRRASISAAIAPFDYSGCHINVIDAPGLFDFELGMYEGVKACETVLISVSARSGALVGTHKAKMFFVSKLASENADFDKVYDGLKAEFGSGVCPVVYPVLEEGKPTVYVDIVNGKAFTYSGGEATAVAMPDTGGMVDELLHALSEAVAETDEALMEKFFMEEPFTHDELVQGIKNGVRLGSLMPVMCGDSIALEGIDLLLDAIKNLSPSPADVGESTVLDKDGKETTVKFDSNGPLVAYVFKTVADPFVGKLSFVKVLSGKLVSTNLVNANTGEQERPGKLLSIKGKKQTDVDAIMAGDIGAVTKLDKTKTGETLCLPGKLFVCPSIEFPFPSMSMAVFSKNKGDEGKIASAIQKIIDEDRTIKYSVNGETSQQLLSGLGEQHLEAVVSKLKAKFGIEIGLEQPRVAYRETIRAKAEAEGKHKKQSGGAGQYGVVQIRFEPLNDGTDFEFVNAVVGGTVPKEFIPAVEKGLREAMQHGVLAGYPMTGVRATLYDGKYHPVDSKEVAFKSAARLAYKAACANAKPALLEPIGLLKAFVPDSNTGDLMGEVNKRRGRVLGMNP
ncbi:MAG: elongation factor G, partial [Oscillospiraceae bacterium]